MQQIIDPRPLTPSWPARLLAVAALVSGVLVAGCAGSSPSPRAASVGSPTTPAPSTASSDSATTARSSTAAGAGATSSTAPGAGGSRPLAFARCMRANGVPNFPDPTPGGRPLFSTTGINPSSPAFQAAQAKCHGFMALPGGPGAPSVSPQQKAQSLAKLRKIAVCMRAHGVSEFPDPRTTPPSSQADPGPGVITDFDGVFLVFPSTINLQAPAYRQALTACGAPPLGLPH
jgi:hypothetical protein